MVHYNLIVMTPRQKALLASYDGPGVPPGIPDLLVDVHHLLPSDNDLHYHQGFVNACVDSSDDSGHMRAHRAS